MYALDTEAGGEQLMGAVHACGARAVVLDTFARVVKGEENQADTVQAFYRHSGIRLKAEGVGYLRIDHAGKNAETNSPRGTSAKRDDVDVIWRQRRTEKGVQLDCSGGSRLSWVGPTLTVDRLVDPITTLVRYSMPVQLGWTAQAIAKARELDAAGVPLDASRPQAEEMLKAKGVAPGRHVYVAEALRMRREMPQMSDMPVPGTGGTGQAPQAIPDPRGQAGTEPVDLFDDQP
jgi:hypothetical protein